MSPQQNAEGAWLRSSKCESGACVEVRVEADWVLIRNSEQPDATVRFTRTEWNALRAGIAAGDFDFRDQREDVSAMPHRSLVV